MWIFSLTYAELVGILNVKWKLDQFLKAKISAEENEKKG